MQSEYTSVELVAKHFPESNSGPFTSIQDALAQGYDVVNPVTGVVQIGVMLDGALIPLLSEKASLVHDAIEAAKLAAANDVPATPATPEEAPSTGPQAGTPPSLQSQETVTTQSPAPPQG